MTADPRPPRWLKPMNRILTAAVRAGLRPGPAMVLTVPGRRTGRPRKTPMTPFRHEGHLYVVAGYPGSDWAANARAAGTGTLRHGRRSRQVRIVELDTEQSRPILRAFAVKVPVGVAFSRRAGLVAEGSPEEFAALAGTLAVFRFDPANR